MKKARKAETLRAFVALEGQEIFMPDFPAGTQEQNQDLLINQKPV